MGVPQNPWFGNNAIQQHLNLNNQQSAQLNKIYNDQWMMYQQQLNALPANLNNDVRSESRRNSRQNFDKNFNTASAGIFTAVFSSSVIAKFTINIAITGLLMTPTSNKS